jgi:hypothetical protein
MLVVCRDDYRGNVDTVDRKEVGDYDGLDIGVKLLSGLNLPLLRAVEAGSSNSSCLFTVVAHTFRE